MKISKTPNCSFCQKAAVIKVRIPELTKIDLISQFRKLKVNPYLQHEEAAYESLKILARYLNHEVFEAIERFASKKTSSCILHIVNLPVCFDALPPTPQTDRHTNNKDWLSEYLHLGIGQLMDAVVYINKEEKDGKPIQQVNPLPGNELLAAGTGSTTPFHLHSENPHQVYPPDIIGLFTLRGDANAVTSYVPVDELINNLPEWVVKALQLNVYTFVTGPSYNKVMKYKGSILFNNEGSFSFRYNSDPERLFVTENPVAIKALAYLREYLADGTVIRGICLKAGDLLLINNKKALHGRTSFVMHTNPDLRRWLQRIYFLKNKAD